MFLAISAKGVFKHQPWRDNLGAVSISYHLLAMRAPDIWGNLPTGSASFGGFPLADMALGIDLGPPPVIHTWRSQDLVVRTRPYLNIALV